MWFLPQEEETCGRDYRPWAFSWEVDVGGGGGGGEVVAELGSCGWLPDAAAGGWNSTLMSWPSCCLYCDDLQSQFAWWLRQAEVEIISGSDWYLYRVSCNVGWSILASSCWSWLDCRSCSAPALMGLLLWCWAIASWWWSGLAAAPWWWVVPPLPPCPWEAAGWALDWGECKFPESTSWILLSESCMCSWTAWPAEPCKLAKLKLPPVPSITPPGPPELPIGFMFKLLQVPENCNMLLNVAGPCKLSNTEECWLRKSDCDDPGCIDPKLVPGKKVWPYPPAATGKMLNWEFDMWSDWSDWSWSAWNDPNWPWSWVPLPAAPTMLGRFKPCAALGRLLSDATAVACPLEAPCFDKLPMCCPDPTERFDCMKLPPSRGDRCSKP